MKKLLALLTAILTMLVVTANAESTSKDLFAQISGQLFEFSSGAGGWGTELAVLENGVFTGNFHDSEMGETGERYPNGTIYGCSFHGQFSDPEPVDEYTWKAKIAVEQDEGQVPEAIEDGIRFVTAAPYGLEKAQTVVFYTPGTPVDHLPARFLIWSHLQEIDPEAKTIPYYAIWNETDDAGFIAMTASMNESEIAAQNTMWDIVDGCFVLSVQTDSTGKWSADEMAQPDSVVKLSESRTENGVLTARYEAVGDGEATVSLRHINEHNTCDELYSYILQVKDGKAQEITGGSYTASPAEAEVDPYISGEWLEKDTQFTTLNVTRKTDGGWYVEITSPVSHGAWVIRATAYHDCEYDAFVYSDGVKYNLIPGETTREEEAETGLQGMLRFTGTIDNLQLAWQNTMNPDGETVTFEKAPGMPAYTYSGDDLIEGAIAAYLASDERANEYLTEPGFVSIPCPIIHKIEMVSDAEAKVYGSFWIMNYVKRGEVLFNISGGEFPAVITLKNVDGQWQVSDMETAGDGDDYAADIKRFAAGDSKLEEKYFAGSDLGKEANQAVRMQFIKAYVDANGLNITAYQDYGWDPIELK